MHVYVQLCDTKLRWQRRTWFAAPFSCPPSHMRLSSHQSNISVGVFEGFTLNDKYVHPNRNSAPIMHWQRCQRGRNIRIKMMALNFELPCAVTCSIISLRGVRQAKNNENESRNYTKGQINNFFVSLLFLVGTSTCQSLSLLIGWLESKHPRGEKLNIVIIIATSGGAGNLPAALEATVKAHRTLYCRSAVV